MNWIRIRVGVAWSDWHRIDETLYRGSGKVSGWRTSCGVVVDDRGDLQKKDIPGYGAAYCDGCLRAEVPA